LTFDNFSDSIFNLTMLVSMSLQLVQMGCMEPGWLSFMAFRRSTSDLPIVLDLTSTGLGLVEGVAVAVVEGEGRAVGPFRREERPQPTRLSPDLKGVEVS